MIGTREELVQRTIDSIKDATQKIKEAAHSLENPEVHKLNRRSALNICATVAVDTGQSLFGGVLYKKSC